jgi:hypothetical protein
MRTTPEQVLDHVLVLTHRDRRGRHVLPLKVRPSVGSFARLPAVLDAQTVVDLRPSRLRHRVLVENMGWRRVAVIIAGHRWVCVRGSVPTSITLYWYPFWRGVERHVEAHAQRRGTSASAEMQQFVLQRALARIFDTHPDDWLLKGGQIFLARNDMARASSDIDLTRLHGDDSPAAMAGDYKAALERDFGDQLTFVPVLTQPLFHFPGVRIRHMVLHGETEVMRLSADVVAENRLLWRDPYIIPFPERPGSPESGRTCVSCPTTTCRLNEVAVGGANKAGRAGLGEVFEVELAAGREHRQAAEDVRHSALRHVAADGKATP